MAAEGPWAQTWPSLEFRSGCHYSPKSLHKVLRYAWPPWTHGLLSPTWPPVSALPWMVTGATDINTSPRLWQGREPQHGPWVQPSPDDCLAPSGSTVHPICMAPLAFAQPSVVIGAMDKDADPVLSKTMNPNSSPSPQQLRSS